MNEKSTPKKYSTEQVADILDRWKISGKTKNFFCKENQLNYMTFIAWAGKRKRQENKKRDNQFIPLQISSNAVFAEISFQPGSKIIFHQPVPADYLLTLIKSC